MIYIHCILNLNFLFFNSKTSFIKIIFQYLKYINQLIVFNYLLFIISNFYHFLLNLYLIHKDLWSLIIIISIFQYIYFFQLNLFHFNLYFIILFYFVYQSTILNPLN